MRVAFTLIPSAAWMGGFNYLHNLTASLARFESGRIQPVVYCGMDVQVDDAEAFASIRGIEVIQSDVFSAPRRKQGLRQALLVGVDREALRCFQQDKIDLPFEVATFYGWRFPGPTLAWLSDFQHRVLSENFSRREWWRREIGFRIQVASGRRILVSSNAARKDCEAFYSSSVGRIEVLRFPARLSAEDFPAEPRAILSRYGISEPFVYLPNHFWKHKNHLLVIEALGRIKQSGSRARVVATGNPADYRHPEYLSELNNRVRKLGVSPEDFVCLGMVPRQHVLALLQTCSALVNPSRFEGWSTTVEEAKALAIPMLLSDIAVHREQAGPIADFFAVDDVDRLCGLLAEAMAKPLSEPRQLKQDSDENLRDFAGRFAAIADSTCGGSA